MSKIISTFAAVWRRLLVYKNINLNNYIMKNSFWISLGCIIVAFIVAWFYNFKPDYEYSWYWIFFHGWLIIPDWIYSWFVDSKACKPELYTSAYNVFWWISVITSGISYLQFILTVILGDDPFPDNVQGGDVVD